MIKHRPLSLEELRSLRKPLRDINTEHHKKLSGLDWLALFITERVGTTGFFLLIACWTVFWIGWNALVPMEFRFDPFPAFVLWLFISNMIQIMLMPLIMIGQNVQGKHAAARALEDFEINKKTEREVEVILQHLENQNEAVLRILQHLEKNK